MLYVRWSMANDDDAFENKVARYASRFDSMTWFAKDAVYGAVMSYMFSALGWKFGRALDAHVLSGVALAGMAVTTPSQQWTAVVATIATAVTVAADLRILGKLAFLLSEPCESEMGSTPMHIADACSLSSTSSTAAYGVILALV